MRGDKRRVRDSVSRRRVCARALISITARGVAATHPSVQRAE